MASTRKIRKTFDCVASKRKAQGKIYQKTKDLSSREELAYDDRVTREGPLASLWRRLVREHRQSPSKGSMR